MRKIILLLAVLSGVILVFLKAGTVLAEPTAKLLEPRSFPHALSAETETAVTFKVHLLNETKDPSPDYLVLHPEDGSGPYKLNDQGKSGDKIAGDNIYGGTIIVSTKARRAGECLQYLASGNIEKTVIESPIYPLCLTSFPIGVAESNTKPENLILVDKNASPVVANELLVRFNSKATEEHIAAAAATVKARIVGSILPRGLYQFRFSQTLTLKQLQDHITTLLKISVVEYAYPNWVGSYASLPNDPEYILNNQHGYQHINADDAWDLGANGSGITIAIPDSGVQAHPDLPIAGADAINHGTPMAGIAAALTNNAVGIAGVAGLSTLESTVLSPDAAVTMSEMVMGLQVVASSSAAQVVIAGFNTTLAPVLIDTAALDHFDLCRAINDIVLNSGTPVAIVISAAGNNNTNGNHYPSKCNEVGAAPHAELTNKSLFIPVMGSCTGGSCPTDTRQADSNFGTWVDVAAPAVNIRGTNNGGGYSDFSGTSFAAALVGGTVAQMLSCGATVSQIQSRLTSTAPVSVPYTGGSAPRIDARAAVLAGNTAPTGIGLSGSTSINENIDTSLGHVIGTLSDIDSNICDAFNYNIQGGADAAFFSIGGPGMNQLVLTAGVLNFEVKSSYSVTVRITDAGGATFNQAFVINVNNLPEPPVVNNQTFSVAENSANGTAVGTVVATDSDMGSVLSYSITGGNTGGAFAINPGTGAITVANTAALDFETTPSFALTVEVSDGVLTDTATVTVNLNNVVENTAPVVNNQTFAINENSANGTVVGTVVASDGEGDSLSYSITGGNTGGAFAINPGTGAITVANTAALDFETTPSFALTVEVSDGVLSGTATVTVNLNNVVENTAPVVNNQTFSINENSANGSVVGTVAASDGEGDSLSFSITGGNTGGAFAIGAGTGTITVANTAALDFETTPSFALTVEVSDGVLSDTATVTVNLNNVVENTAPAVNNQTFSINENSANGSVVGTVAASDGEGDSLSFSITGGNTGGAFAIGAGTGTITVANSAALDFETTPSFALTVEVSDGALTDTATITVNLNNLPDTGIPNPIIGWVMPVPYETYLDAFGNPYIRYRFEVTNRSDYPVEMFEAAPSLPPCGLNANSSRTWVYIYNGVTNAYIYGFCALGTPDNMGQIWFAIPDGGTPPPSIYITLIDRQTSTVYTSNTLTVP